MTIWLKTNLDILIFKVILFELLTRRYHEFQIFKKFLINLDSEFVFVSKYVTEQLILEHIFVFGF